MNISLQIPTSFKYPKVILIHIFSMIWMNCFFLKLSVIYISTNSIQFPCPPLSLSFVVLVIAILTCVSCFSVCVFLLSSDVWYLFIYHLSTCMSPLRNVCLGPLPILNHIYLAFWLFSSTSSLYIEDINPLPDRWFADIFFSFHRLPFYFGLLF